MKFQKAIPGLLAASLLSACPTPPSSPLPPASTTGCNGAEELCGRALDQIAFAATHNGMSNAAEQWSLPNHEYGLEQQLRDGVRGFLLDTHTWRGESFLCHGFCELGATPLVEGLETFTRYLDENPGVFVQILFQDGISPEATADAFEAAGLLDRAYAHPTGTQWPTLGTLLDQGLQLLVSAEHGGPPPDWYHHAWALYSDTAYSFREVDDFSCSLFRGEANSPLFLMNHWLSAPFPGRGLADQANAYEVLLGRAEACAEERGRIPNLIAVDFYDRGDLLEVVGVLNGTQARRDAAP